MQVVYLAALAAASALALSGQHADVNPFSSAQDFEDGKRLYRTSCGVCHGMEGKTGRGARLAVRTHRLGNTDAELFRIISNGVSGTEMPGLWMEEDDVWKILLFMRSLEVNAGEACATSPGEAAKGRELYESSSCEACHTVDHEGGRIGPDLTYIGVNYGRDQLRDSLVEPNKDIGVKYQTVRAVHNGSPIEGVLLNSNNYTVHIFDMRENIRSFSRDELDSFESLDKSLMPAYGHLNDGQLNDLLTYMCSLRGKK